MARLIQTTDGDWIDPAAVTGIGTIIEHERGDKDNYFRIAIHGPGGRFLVGYYASPEAADAVRDELAALVNRSSPAPSAPLALNLNARVCVTLTEVGLRRLREDYAELGCEPWKPDENPREFELWRLMHVYGPKLYAGATEMPFVDNEIVVLDARTG